MAEDRPPSPPPNGRAKEPIRAGLSSPMTTAWMYASSTDGERWILQGLRTWGLSITRALRRAGDEPPRIGTLLDRAHSRSGVFCQAAEALWLRSLGSHDTRPILSALRRLAEAVVALTGPKAKITGAIREIDIDLGDVPTEERESLDEVLFLWRRLSIEGTKPLSLRQPPALGPHRRSAHPPLDPRDPLSWLRALRVGDGARMHVEFSDAPATPSSPKPPPDEVPIIGPRLTTSQAVVFTSLTRLWESRGRPETIAGTRLRRHPLLIGPSGTGKSLLPRELARVTGASFYSTSPGSWIIHGARHQPFTLAAIARRFQNAGAMVVFVDELEKLGTRHANTSDWTRCVYDELFCLLDGRLDGIDGWNAALEARAKTDMLVVCAATFQHLYREKIGAAGDALFDEQWQDVSIRDAIGGQDLLPEELIYRFGAILELAHPTADELRERVDAMHAELGICADPEAVARRLLRSGKGMRALEEYLTGLVLIPPHAT